jgi:hypothetical protein
MIAIPFVTYRTDQNEGKIFRCKACGNTLTALDQLVEIEGSSSHSFTNPSGIQFGFHTFSACPGASVLGEATEAYSWFPGFRWRLAVCGRCGSHVGWHYESEIAPVDEFWGIIVSSTASS